MRWLAPLCLLVAACFSTPDYDDGFLRCELGTGACPTGYECGPDQRCYHKGAVKPTIDAGGCANGDRRCEGKMQQQCMGGAFVTVGNCDKSCLMGFCVECAPATLRCDGNQPQKCNNSGGWANEVACVPPKQLCDEGLCVAGCTPGVRRCSASTLQECDLAGIFRTVESCTFVCTAGACGGECRPGAKRCGTDQTPQTCSADGKWGNGTPCPGVCSGDGTCSGECRPGATRCAAGNQLQTCNGSGQWGTSSACTFVCVTGESQCSGECTPGAKRCSGSAVQECSASGRWVDQTNCAPGPCTLGECRACNDGEKQCNADIPQQCGGGVWTNSQPNACPFLCANGLCTGECVPGSYACQGKVSRSCGATGTYTDTTCPFVCVTATGQCGGSCEPGSKRCSGDVSQTCQASGEWNAGQSCSFGCDTGTGSCNACVPDDLTVTCANGGCGQKTNNCGDKVNCPSCVNPKDSCGGGGVPGVCGCTPMPNACAGKCGSVDDGCQIVECGPCPDGGVAPPDAAPPDAPLPPDAAPPDAPLPLDAAPPDAHPDGPLPLDAALPDARPDGPLPPDAAGPDACQDPPNPCASAQCGSVPLCSGSMFCGDCSLGETCEGNICRCSTQEEACGHHECGFAPRCGDRWFSCWQFKPPECGAGISCTDEPGLCQDCDDEDPCLSRECGPTTDNCGLLVECGREKCRSGLCAGNIDKANCLDSIEPTCLQCEKAGFKKCCIRPGGFDLYCTNDAVCPLGAKTDPIDDYGIKADLACDNDSDPCERNQVPCGPIQNACGDWLECGGCEDTGSGNVCIGKEGGNTCETFSSEDPCKDCCSSGGDAICCERPGFTPYCTSAKLVGGSCPTHYKNACAKL